RVKVNVEKMKHQSYITEEQYRTAIEQLGV
ncbi:glycosyltransferase, partial [Staphylococcus gallinarum]